MTISTLDGTVRNGCLLLFLEVGKHGSVCTQNRPNLFDCCAALSKHPTHRMPDLMRANSALDTGFFRRPAYEPVDWVCGVSSSTQLLEDETRISSLDMTLKLCEERIGKRELSAVPGFRIPNGNLSFRKREVLNSKSYQFRDPRPRLQKHSQNESALALYISGRFGERVDFFVG